MVARKRLNIKFYVHCPSSTALLSSVLCKLPVAVPFQTNYRQSTDVPTPDTVPIFPSLCICRQISGQSLVCVFLHIHVVMCRATLMYLYSQYWRIIYIGRKCQAVQWSRVSTRGINEMNVQSFKRFVNFYCRRGKSLAILPPHYARASQTTAIDVLNRNSVLMSLSTVGRILWSLLRDEANLCQSRICSKFCASLIGAVCTRVGPEGILEFGVDKVALGQNFSKSLSFPCQCHSIIAPYSSCIYSLLSAEGRRAEAGNFPRVSGLSEMEERWLEQCDNVIVCCSNVALPNCTESYIDRSIFYGDQRQKVPLVVKERKKK
jgi:hypothetical protein